MEPNEQEENQQDQSAVTEQEAPPATPQPSVEEIRTIYNAALQEASQRAAASERELERLRQERAAPNAPAQSIEEEREAFFNNPRELIREEMRQAIRPLNEFQQRFSKEQFYADFIRRVSSLPAFVHMNNPLVQGYLQNAAGSMNELSDQALAGAYNMIVGHLYSTGQLTQNAPAEPTKNEMQPPPNPRPATPLIPVPDKVKNAPKLSEHEKMLAKFNGMSEQEYFDFLNIRSDEVANSKIGVKNG